MTRDQLIEAMNAAGDNAYEDAPEGTDALHAAYLAVLHVVIPACQEAVRNSSIEAPTGVEDDALYYAADKLEEFLINGKRSPGRMR